MYSNRSNEMSVVLSVLTGIGRDNKHGAVLSDMAIAC